ncbi:MAG: hypothetical protein ACI9UH_000553 [Gammaproteobacteria bacterium]|jgi:hypothetical protein
MLSKDQTVMIDITDILTHAFNYLEPHFDLIQF